VKRREALRLGVAAAAVPLLPRSVALAAGETTTVAGKFFSAPELALLDELAEMIIPSDEHSGGARAARVAAYIDGRLADYDPAIQDLADERAHWKAGLAAIDDLARQGTGKAFLEATPEQRTSVLTGVAAAEKDPQTEAQRFFGDLKEWTARGYYTSSIGIHDEMEYKGNTMQDEYAGTDVATLPKIGAGLVMPSVVGGIQLGVGSYSYRKFDIDRMIASMKSIGLSSVELWNGHLDPAKTSADDYRSVKSRFDAAGIQVSAYCVNFKTDWSDELIDKGFGGATLLGTKLMTASVEKPILDRLDAQCVKHKISLGLHNHYLGDPWFNGDKSINFEGPDDFAEALKGRSQYLAINLDIGHFFAAGHDPLAYFKEHYARIVSLHIKDRDDDAAKTNRGPGEGKTPIVEVLRLAKQVRFRYAANLEWELDDADPTDGVRRSFEYMKNALA